MPPAAPTKLYDLLCNTVGARVTDQSSVISTADTALSLSGDRSRSRKGVTDTAGAQPRDRGYRDGGLAYFSVIFVLQRFGFENPQVEDEVTGAA